LTQQPLVRDPAECFSPPTGKSGSAALAIEHRGSWTAERAQYLWLAGAVLLSCAALLLRLHDISHESLWYDEGYTLLFSRMSIQNLVLVGGAHEHPPLFYLLVHAMPDIDAVYLAPRFLAAVAGSVAVFALYCLGSRLFGRPAGLVAAVLLTISPLHLWQSQDGRAYELAGLFVILSYLALATTLDRREHRWWLAYVLCTLLALYTDYTTVFTLIPQVVLLPAARGRRQVRPLLLAWLSIGLLYLPWVPMLIGDTSGVVQGYWIPSPTVNAVAQAALELLGLASPCPTGTSCTVRLAPVPLLSMSMGIAPALIAAAALAVLVHGLRRRELTLVMVVLWLLVPFALLLLISTVRPLFLDRYVMGASFPIYLMLGVLATRFTRFDRRAFAAAAAVVVLAALNVVDTRMVFATQTNPDWKSPMRDLASAYVRGQAVAYYPGVAETIARAYLPASWHPTRQQALWLHTYLDVPGWQKRWGSLTDHQLRDLQFSALSAHLTEVWVAQERYAGSWDVWDWFTTHGFHLLLDEQYPGQTSLQLWSRGAAQAFGPAVLPPASFGPGWQARGKVTLHGRTARESGRATLTHTFPIVAGAAYTVGLTERTPGTIAIRTGEPQATVQVYPACPASTAASTAAYPAATVFPQLAHFDLWTNGAWVNKPFGFVAPAGMRCAVITLRTTKSSTVWRDVGVYRERST
jgi:mannosyltransferase